MKEWIRTHISLFVHGVMFVAFFPLALFFLVLGMGGDEAMLEEAVPAFVGVWVGMHILMGLLIPPVLKASGYTRNDKGKLVPPEFTPDMSQAEKDALVQATFARSTFGRIFNKIIWIIILAAIALAFLAEYAS